VLAQKFNIDEVDLEAYFDRFMEALAKGDLRTAIENFPITAYEFPYEEYPQNDPDTFIEYLATIILEIHGDTLPDEEVPAETHIIAHGENCFTTYRLPVFMFDNKDQWADVTKLFLETLNGFGYFLISEAWTVVEMKKDDRDKYPSLEDHPDRIEVLMANYMGSGTYILYHREIREGRTLGPIEVVTDGGEAVGRFPDIIKRDVN